MRPLIHKLTILIRPSQHLHNKKETMERDDMKIEHKIPVELQFCLVTEIEVNHLALQL